MTKKTANFVADFSKRFLLFGYMEKSKGKKKLLEVPIIIIGTRATI